MLQTDDRVLLREAIRPPDGYEMDEAIVTTYSLDLLSLLTVPLYFTLFEAEGPDGTVSPDPLALLQALRRHASKVTVFCQAGEIVVPARQQQLYGYLESSIVEAKSPQPKGVFHPKVWALRYVRPGQPVMYRFACFSRNLTADRSWDTAVVLEGQLRADRKVGFSQNRPLGEFVASLVHMAVRAVDPVNAARAGRMADELRRVAFDPPEGFDRFTFWPIGHAGKQPWPFNFQERVSRMLVVSPFVSAAMLGRLASVADSVQLVSRPDQLDCISPEQLDAFADVSVLADAVESEQAAETAELPEVATDTAALSGLHAKLYVADYGWDASVFTGSANATHAAFDRNVEFLVELLGKRSVCGVEATITGSQGQRSLGALLQPYQPIEGGAGIDLLQQELEDQVADASRDIATQSLALVAALQPTGAYQVEVRRDGRSLGLPDLAIRCWLITLSEDQAVRFESTGQAAAVFAELSAEALSTFLAVSVTAARDGKSFTKRFVLNLPLSGGPSDRRERILRTVLRDRQRVLRFLLLLLGDFDALVSGDLPPLPGEGGGETRQNGGSEAVALLEPIIRALHRDPTRLDQIAKLVEELKLGEGEDLLPAEFGPVWDIVWAARQEAIR